MRRSARATGARAPGGAPDRRGPRPPAPGAGRGDAADVAVVIPARDRPDALAACLARVGPCREIVIVDDGSSDPDAIARAAPTRTAAPGVAPHRAVRARRPARRRSGGPAAARNAGLAATDAPFVAFLDSDTLPRGRLAGAAARALRRSAAGRGRAARAGPGRADRRSRATRRSARRSTSARTRASSARAGAWATSPPPRSSSAAPRSPPFDETMRFGEDVDLVWRLAAAGLDRALRAGERRRAPAPGDARGVAAPARRVRVVGRPARPAPPRPDAPRRRAARRAAAVGARARRPAAARAARGAAARRAARRRRRGPRARRRRRRPRALRGPARRIARRAPPARDARAARARGPRAHRAADRRCRLARARARARHHEARPAVPRRRARRRHARPTTSPAARRSTRCASPRCAPPTISPTPPASGPGCAARPHRCAAHPRSAASKKRVTRRSYSPATSRIAAVWPTCGRYQTSTGAEPAARS